MTRRQLDAVVRHLSQTIQTQATTVLTDGQLLGRFLREREAQAFTTLVHRHASMVLTVARRVLRDVHDAEDVFQATFLVLAKKAGSIRRRRALAGWLYQVAYHLALRAKAEKARRHSQQRQVQAMASAGPVTDLDRDELRAVLDQELGRLPEKYRTPLVLHHLEGKSKDETARQLGWAEGTVSGRLDRARKLLRRRLIRRGFVLSSTCITTVLIEGTATATVPPLLVKSAVEAALVGAGIISSTKAVSAAAKSLAEGMVRTMWFAGFSRSPR